MPRCARVKSPDSIYHIMVRSISDTPLFKCSNDKDMYLGLIRKYQVQFDFKVYAYCLMDTHAHIIIDCNGADISKIMHCINQCYTQYFNRVYNRHGHLFQDRFKSKIVKNDKGIIALSAYIHTNPNDLPGYKDKWEHYIYSSMGIYLGLTKDDFNILEIGFIMDYFGKDSIGARYAYRKLVIDYSKKPPMEDVEFTNEKAEYRSERTVLIRDAKPEDIVAFVAAYMNKDEIDAHVKHIRASYEMKAISAFLMRNLCDMKLKDIGRFIGNVSEAYISKLCQNGYKLICERPEYRNIAKDFLKRNAS